MDALGFMRSEYNKKIARRYHPLTIYRYVKPETDRTVFRSKKKKKNRYRNQRHLYRTPVVQLNLMRRGGQICSGRVCGQLTISNLKTFKI